MFEAFSDLYVERIRLVRNTPLGFPLSTLTRCRQSVLDRIENVAQDDHRPARRSSVELACTAVQGAISERWSSVIYGQSYPDREPLALGLQKILHLNAIPASRFSGLSHLKGAVALEGIASLDLFLETGETGGLVVTEQFPYLSQTQRDGHVLECGAMAVSLSRTKGAIKVLGIHRTVFPIHVGKKQGEEFWGLLRAKYPDLRLAGGEAVLEAPTEDQSRIRLPFQCWEEFALKLERGHLRVSNRAALLATDSHRLLSALIVEIQGTLPVERVTV